MIVVDSHLHVWSDDEGRYPWRPLTGFGPPQRFPGSLELLLGLQAASGVDKAVLVQPANYDYDHSYLFACCRRYPGRFAAVGLVDPLADDAPQTLARLVREQGLGGLRLRPLWTPDDWRWLTSPATCRLWETASELAIPISLLILPKQIPALGEMVARFPQVRVVVDHLGRPYAAEAPTYESSASLLELATYPNTYVKVSALSAASRQPYPYADAIGFVRRVYERFGARRLMWGTDFPYVQLKEGYAKARALVEHYDFMTAADKEWLLGRTALSVYDFAPARFA